MRFDAISAKRSSVPSNLAEIFYRGDNRGVLDRTLDSKKGGFRKEDLRYVIGALSFMGRYEEAERLFNDERKSIQSEETLAACQFFLGLGFCRHSFYSKAREYFVRNLLLTRKVKKPIPRFYAFQGLSFYWFTFARFKLCLRAAEKAHRYATQGAYGFGKYLASDIRGHALLQTGQIARGLRSLDEATRLARTLKSDSFVKLTENQAFISQNRHGLKGNEVAAFRKRLQSLVDQDTFSRTALLIELGRQLTLRGEFSRAKETLNEAVRLTYANQNRKHELYLSVIYAHLLSLTGEIPLALSFVQSAKRQIVPLIDRALEVKVLGIEARLCREMGLPKDPKRIEKIAELTLKTGQAQAVRTLERERKLPSTFTLKEDPLGDLIGEAELKKADAVEDVLKSGFWSLLYRCLPIVPGESVLYFDLVPGSVTALDAAGICHVGEGLSTHLRKLGIFLSAKERSKDEIIRHVWGYDYHPLRHDPLIYAAIGKLRRLLGTKSDFIRATDRGYCLREGVRLAVHRPQELQAVAEPQFAEPVLRALEHSLNLRQLKILKALESGRALDAPGCSRMLAVAQITASRDLNYLVQQRLLVRLGKGRATRYLRA